MLRFLSRFTGYWLIAAALVAAVVDGAKSIAASALVLTPLAQTWATLSALAAGPNPAEPATVGAITGPLGGAAELLLSAPTAAVLGVLGFLLLASGRRRRRPALGREFAA